MLLSQQAELISIQSKIVEIGIAPNWENMIKSRKVVIEDAVKKIFGEHMAISFKSKKNNINSTNSKNLKFDKEDDIQQKFSKTSNLNNEEH